MNWANYSLGKYCLWGKPDSSPDLIPHIPVEKSCATQVSSRVISEACDTKVISSKRISVSSLNRLLAVMKDTKAVGTINQRCHLMPGFIWGYIND